MAWSSFTIFGMTIFDFLDTVATNIMLPLGGILLCIYMGWIAPRKFFRDELTNHGTLTSHAFGLIALHRQVGCADSHRHNPHLAVYLIR